MLITRCTNFGRWRKYAFCPNPDTIYEEAVLKLIIPPGIIDDLEAIKKWKEENDVKFVTLPQEPLDYP